MCCGETNALPMKRLVKVYIEQLKPKQLMYNVKVSDPQTIEEAQNEVYEQAKLLRIVKQQARYFRDPNDVPKTQKKIKIIKEETKVVKAAAAQEEEEEETEEKVVKSFPHIKCYNCNEMGHYASSCPRPPRARKSKQMILCACDLERTSPVSDNEPVIDQLFRVPGGIGPVNVFFDSGANINSVRREIVEKAMKENADISYQERTSSTTEFSCLSKI